MADDPTFGASAILGTPPPTATMLDGTQEPLPPATPDQPAIGVLRQQAMGRLQELKGNDEFRALLLKGDPHALNEMRRLERITKTPTGTFYGGVETPEQHEQHQQAWRNNADIGVHFGSDVEQQLRMNGAITEAEHRTATAKLAELKSDKEFLKRYFDGNVKAKAQFQLLHRMLQLPVSREQK
jgi:hypothetical protein